MQELIKNKLKMNEHIKIDCCHRLSRKKNQDRPALICLFELAGETTCTVTVR